MVATAPAESRFGHSEADDVSAVLDRRILDALEVAKQRAERIVSGGLPAMSDENGMLDAAEVEGSSNLQQHYRRLALAREQKLLESLQEEIEAKKAKEREFVLQMDGLMQSHEGRQHELQDRIAALLEEKRQLESICELQETEHGMVQVQLEDMASHKASCESRVQFLMDLLVSLLSNGVEGAGASTLVEDVLRDGQDREYKNRLRQSRVQDQLDQVRQENRTLAQRLSHIFSSTTAVHDKLCARQNELFTKRTSTSLLLTAPTCAGGSAATAAAESVGIPDAAERHSSASSTADVVDHRTPAASSAVRDPHPVRTLGKLEDAGARPLLDQVQVLTYEDAEAMSIAKLLSEAANPHSHQHKAPAQTQEVIIESTIDELQTEEELQKSNEETEEELVHLSSDAHVARDEEDVSKSTIQEVESQQPSTPSCVEDDASSTRGSASRGTTSVSAGQSRPGSDDSPKEAHKAQLSAQADDRRLKKEGSNNGVKSNGEFPATKSAGPASVIGNLSILERRLRDALLEVAFDRPVVRIAGNPGIYRFGDDISALVTLASPDGELMVQRCEHPDAVPPASLYADEALSAPQPVSVFLQEIRSERSNAQASGGAKSAPVAAQQEPSVARRLPSPEAMARRPLQQHPGCGSAPAPGSACAVQLLSSNTSPSHSMSGTCGGSGSLPITASSSLTAGRPSRASPSGAHSASTPPAAAAASKRRLAGGRDSAAAQPRSPGVSCNLANFANPRAAVHDRAKESSRLSPLGLPGRVAPFRSSRASHPGEVSQLARGAQQTPPPPLRMGGLAPPPAATSPPSSQVPQFIRNAQNSSGSLGSPLKGCPAGPCLAAQVDMATRASAPPATLRAASVEELLGRASSPQSAADRTQRVQARVLQSASASSGMLAAGSSPMSMRSSRLEAQSAGPGVRSMPATGQGSGSYCPAGNLGSATYPGGSGTYGSGTYTAGSMTGNSPQASAFSTPRRQTLGAQRPSPPHGIQAITKAAGEARSYSPQGRASSGSLTAPMLLRPDARMPQPQGIPSSASYGGMASTPTVAVPGVQRSSLEAKEHRGDLSHSPSHRVTIGAAAAGRQTARSVPRFATAAAAPAAAARG